MIQETVNEFGRLDVLIGNAGVGHSGQVADISLEDWDANFGVNLTANFILTKHALPHLRKTKGCIVYTSSIACNIFLSG